MSVFFNSVFLFYLISYSFLSQTVDEPIKDGKLLLSETKNNIAAYTYSKEQGQTFTYVAYEKTFFPKGVTFILRKIVP